MCIVNNMDADLLQLCISRRVCLLPSIYYAFLDLLDEMERKHTVCLVPLARFEIFHHKLDPAKMSTKKTKEPVKAVR